MVGGFEMLGAYFLSVGVRQDIKETLIEVSVLSSVNNSKASLSYPPAALLTSLSFVSAAGDGPVDTLVTGRLGGAIRGLCNGGLDIVSSRSSPHRQRCDSPRDRHCEQPGT